MASSEPSRGPVLLVGNPRGSARGIRDALSDAGFTVRELETGPDALQVLEGKPIRGVVCDHDLPGMDGFHLLRAIRLSDSTVPVIIVGSHPATSLPDAARSAAVTGVVSPVDDVEQVLRVLRQDDVEHRVQEEHLDRYRHLVESSPAPINLFDADGCSIWGNDAVLDLLELESRADLVGRSIFDFIHPADHDTARQELDAVVDQKRSAGPTQMRLELGDGVVKHIQVSTAIGQFLGEDIGQAVVLDVTELRELEVSLREERLLLENALDAIDDAFYVIDPSGDIERWNERALTVTGYTADEFQAIAVDDLFAPGDRERVYASIQTVIETGEDVLEAKVETKDGQSIPYEFRCRRLDSGDGGVKVVGIGRDVSERSERNRHLRILETWLRHNIRNDMNLIQGLAANIEHNDEDDVSESARTIQAAAEHIIEQADKERALLDLLTEPPEPTTIELEPLLTEEVATIRERFPAASIDVEVPYTATVSAIPSLRNAVGELLENAVEHNGRETPSVTVSAERAADGRVEVRIADDGPSIPESERETVLGSREIDQLTHGSGLGLLVVYWVMRLSAGDVRFEANEPRGNVVILSLPLAT